MDYMLVLNRHAGLCHKIEDICVAFQRCYQNNVRLQVWDYPTNYCNIPLTGIFEDFCGYFDYHIVKDLSHYEELKAKEAEQDIEISFEWLPAERSQFRISL